MARHASTQVNPAYGLVSESDLAMDGIVSFSDTAQTAEKKWDVRPFSTPMAVLERDLGIAQFVHSAFCGFRIRWTNPILCVLSALPRLIVGDQYILSRGRGSKRLFSSISQPLDVEYCVEVTGDESIRDCGRGVEEGLLVCFAAYAADTLLHRSIDASVHGCPGYTNSGARQPLGGHHGWIAQPQGKFTPSSPSLLWPSFLRRRSGKSVRKNRSAWESMRERASAP